MHELFEKKINIVEIVPQNFIWPPAGATTPQAWSVLRLIVDRNAAQAVMIYKKWFEWGQRDS